VHIQRWVFALWQEALAVLMHTYTTQHAFDGENEHTLVISFTYTPGTPARGQTFSCAGEPAQEPEVEVIRMLVDGVPATFEQLCDVDENERLYDELALHAASS